MVLLVMKEEKSSVYIPSFDDNYASTFICSKSKACPL